MAADVLSHATRGVAVTGAGLISRRPPQDSASTPLPGGAFPHRETLLAEARATTRDAAVGEQLAQSYGAHWRRVWQYAEADPLLGTRIVEQLPYVLAEVPHAVTHELACTLADVLVRRTHIAFETRDHGRAAARHIAPHMAAALQWNETTTAAALAAYDAEVTRLFAVDAV
jgi:glycerol-3-phosphate dehydrogenase